MIVKMAAPALSAVVIGACSVVGSLAAVDPAFGSLADVAPVDCVRGAISGMLSVEPITDSAAIYFTSVKIILYIQ